jgi:hypothetical protein
MKMYLNFAYQKQQRTIPSLTSSWINLKIWTESKQINWKILFESTIATCIIDVTKAASSSNKN